MGCHFLLQGIFLTQGSNLGLPHSGQTLYLLSHQGSPAGCPWDVSGSDPGRGPVVEKGTPRAAETPESLLGGLSQSWHPARTTRPGRATWAAEETRPSGRWKRLAGRLPPRRCARLTPAGWRTRSPETLHGPCSRG